VKNKTSPYAKYSSDKEGEFDGGWGRQVLGETWIDHWGDHGEESTRGVIAERMEDSPLVRGCEHKWGPTDVYKVRTLPGDSKPAVMGQVLRGMTPDSPPNTDKKLMPIAWTKTYTAEKGKTARVFITTIGAGLDFESGGLRRLFVNACYWCLGMEDKIPARANADTVGEYKPGNLSDRNTLSNRRHTQSASGHSRR